MINTNHVADKIPVLVNAELKAANKEHPLFASMHEGYAVLLEEVEEAQEELDKLTECLKAMWLWVREDEPRCFKDRALSMYFGAMELAGEAIQVAAMAQKALDSMEGKE